MREEVLITGGLGYIGGRVAKHLAQNNYSLRLTTRKSGVAHPPGLEQGEILACDLFDDAQLAAACRGVQCVVHLAAANENVCVTNPEEGLRINGLAPLRTLRAAIAAGAARFVYLSTAHVYGAPLKGVITEETPPRPVHPYAITHRVAEDFVLAEQRKGSIEGVVLRLSNGFGVAERPDVDRWTLLVNDLCRQAATTREMVMRSAGDELRDFITLEDVARAVDHALKLEHSALSDGLFNVGSGRAMRVRDMTDLIAQRCESALGYRPKIIRPESISPAAPLEYCIRKFGATGFSLAGDMSAEIDATLLLCRDAFGQQS
jgi:UDP-glucose 4-epimerase